MGRPSLRRRKFFIKKEFQGKFIALYTFGVILLAGATTLVLNGWLHNIVDEQIYSSHMKVQRTGELFLTPLIQTNLYAIIAVGILVLAFSLVVFKRLNLHFARVDATFNRMAAGDYGEYTPVYSLSEELNTLLDMVGNAQEQYEGELTELRQICAEAEQLIAAGVTPEGAAALHERLAAAVRKIQLPESG